MILLFHTSACSFVAHYGFFAWPWRCWSQSRGGCWRWRWRSWWTLRCTLGPVRSAARYRPLSPGKCLEWINQMFATQVYSFISFRMILQYIFHLNNYRVFRTSFCSTICWKNKLMLNTNIIKFKRIGSHLQRRMRRGCCCGKVRTQVAPSQLQSFSQPPTQLVPSLKLKHAWFF